jgi:hypothetical protein
MATVPGSAPIALAAWCRATGAAPGALEPNWARAPEFAARVLQEAPSEERASWAAEALGGWNLADLLAGEPEVAKAVARVLTLAPEPLANPDLARLASDLVRTSQPDGPCLATLERLGTPTRPDHLALLLEAALGAGEGGGDEHDQALRQIVLRMFEEDPSRALSLAGQFTNPNVVGWLIGNIIASGRAADLPAAEFRALAPHPFLIGAYSLEAP